MYEKGKKLFLAEFSRAEFGGIPHPTPERRQVLINGGPGRDHELGISPPPHVLCAVYAPDPCMTQDTPVG